MSATNPIDVTIQVSKQGSQAAYQLSYSSGGFEVQGGGNWSGVNEDMVLEGSLHFEIIPPNNSYTVASEGHLQSSGDGKILFMFESVGIITALLTVTSISPAPSETLSISGGGGSWIIAQLFGMPGS